MAWHRRLAIDVLDIDPLFLMDTDAPDRRRENRSATRQPAAIRLRPVPGLPVRM